MDIQREQLDLIVRALQVFEEHNVEAITACRRVSEKIATGGLEAAVSETRDLLRIIQKERMK